MRTLKTNARSSGQSGLLRYRQLADDLSEAISAGLLHPGERLPSVRQACLERGVSPSTVFQAYAWLQAHGLIESRARSGHYVRSNRQLLRAPQAAQPQSQAQPVALSDLAFELITSAQDSALVPLGSAFPASSLFPFEALARCGARAMRQSQPAQITSALTAGDPRLRHLLRRRYALHGTTLQEDELIITNGALEALNLSLQAVTRAGDVVVVESPTFYAALQVLERLGLQAVEVHTDPTTGIDLQALEALLAQRKVAALWCMPNFQNPLGALMPLASKQALAKLLARHRLPMIEDDVYGELHAGARRPPPVKAFDSEGWVLHCASFSKCLAPGYRVGWAAAGRFRAQVQRLKMMSTLATSLPPQLAVAEYLAQGHLERHLTRLRLALAQQQARAQQSVQAHFPPGTRMTQPAGGYFLWLELPAQVDAHVLHQQAMAERISTAPGVLFSADARFKHHLRLNVGHPSDQRFEPALQRLGALATALAGKRR